MAKYCWLSTCAVAALAVGPNVARAQDEGPRGGVICLGAIGDTRVEGDLNVVGRCTLNGTEVRGKVTLFVAGALIARDARIRGDLEGNRADFVDLQGTRVDGKVKLDGLVGDLTSFEERELHGDVELTANRSALEILNSNFSRNLVVNRNTGGVTISGTFVGNDLLCDANTPAPTGTGNTVEGKIEGQCASLVPTDPPPQPAASPPPPTTTPAPAPTPTPTPTPAPPPSRPPAATTPAAPPAEVAFEDGGAGAMGWLTVLLIPVLLARRRLARR